MSVNAIGTLRSAVPDLLDRSAGATVRETVSRVLADHAQTFERVLRSRSRRSGRTTFIEIHLAYDAALSMADVQQRVEVLQASIRRELRDAEVAVVATSTPA